MIPENQLASISPAFQKNNIPVVFATDENFVLCLSVALQSLVEHSSPAQNYDIIILEEHLNSEQKKMLQSLLNRENFSLRFINMTPWIEEQGRNLFYLHSHFSVATYYRLFICDILKNYEKIIYLDGDIVLLADLADLFQIDLGTHYLGATKNLAYVFSGKYYIQSILGMSSVENYFQAGVLLLSLQNMRNDHLSDSFLRRFKQIKQPPTVDQNILNSVCEGHMLYLPQEWNYRWQHGDILKRNTAKRSDLYQTSQVAEKNMKIIHYATTLRTWNSPEGKFSNLWWIYAGITPFFQQIHFNFLLAQIHFLKQENGRISLELQQVYHSIPWRVTWPLRALYDFLKYQIPPFFHQVAEKIKWKKEKETLNVSSILFDSHPCF